MADIVTHPMRKLIRFALILLLLAPISVGAQGFTTNDSGATEAAESAGFTTSLACQDRPGGCIPVFVGQIVNALLGVFGSLFLILIVWGGVQYMFAGGDPQKTMKARQTIANAIIGMIIVIASYAIANFILTALAQAASQTSPAETP